MCHSYHHNHNVLWLSQQSQCVMLITTITMCHSYHHSHNLSYLSPQSQSVLFITTITKCLIYHHNHHVSVPAFFWYRGLKLLISFFYRTFLSSRSVRLNRQSNLEIWFSGFLLKILVISGIFCYSTVFSVQSFPNSFSPFVTNSEHSANKMHTVFLLKVIAYYNTRVLLHVAVHKGSPSGNKYLAIFQTT
jgi:hypothetical protein